MSKIHVNLSKQFVVFAIKSTSLSTLITLFKNGFETKITILEMPLVSINNFIKTK